MYPLPDIAPAPLDPRSRTFIQAAGLLEISEYDLMAIAYREWYGQSASRQVLERHFRPYMFGGPPPFWAHRLATEVLELDDRGELKSSRFGVEPPPKATSREIMTGVSQTLILICLVIILFEALIRYAGKA